MLWACLSALTLCTCRYGHTRYKFAASPNIQAYLDILIWDVQINFQKTLMSQGDLLFILDKASAIAELNKPLCDVLRGESDA